MIMQRRIGLPLWLSIGDFRHATAQPFGHLELKSLPCPLPCIHFLLQFEIFGNSLSPCCVVLWNRLVALVSHGKVGHLGRNPLL
jgi:hypothetical protein